MDTTGSRFSLICCMKCAREWGVSGKPSCQIPRQFVRRPRTAEDPEQRIDVRPYRERVPARSCSYCRESSNITPYADAARKPHEACGTQLVFHSVSRSRTRTHTPELAVRPLHGNHSQAVLAACAHGKDLPLLIQRIARVEPTRHLPQPLTLRH